MDELNWRDKRIENFGINNYGVMSLVTGDVREIPLEVQYSPKEDNSAHSDILIPISTIDLTEMREMLSDIAEIVIDVPPLDPKFD